MAERDHIVLARPTQPRLQLVGRKALFAGVPVFAHLFDDPVVIRGMAVGEADLLTDLRLHVPACSIECGRDEFRADIAFAKFRSRSHCQAPGYLSEKEAASEA